MSRVNRAIELLEQGQPLYYTGAGELSYENGVEMAQTWADYLMVEMEHFAFNIPGLSAFMHGLIAGGPDPQRPPHADGDRYAADRRHE